MLGRQRLACLQLQDDLVDLGAIQRPLNSQHNGQRYHDIAVRHEQITSRDIAVRNERPDCFLAMADAFTRLSKVVGGRPSIVITEQHVLSSPAGRQFDAMAIHIREDIRDRTGILARLGHQRSKRFPNMRHRRDLPRTPLRGTRPEQACFRQLFPSPEGVAYRPMLSKKSGAPDFSISADAGQRHERKKMTHTNPKLRTGSKF
jgi:hypothetical protein